jgi:hypothetical protein
MNDQTLTYTFYIHSQVQLAEKAYKILFTDSEIVRVKENAGMLAEYIMLQTTNQSQLPVVHPAEKQFTLLC